jgi:hypothetical protein
VLSIEAIKNFNEEVVMNIISNTFTDNNNSSIRSSNEIQPQAASKK